MRIMAYAKESTNYGIPYISNNEILDGSEEEIAAEIIDNQIRAGILGAGGTRVFQNGVFTAEIVDSFTGMVELTLSPAGSGLPSVQGIANNGLIEVYDQIIWSDLATNSFYYIYVQSIDGTYVDPTSVNIISSVSEITQNDHLLLATLDTTDTNIGTPPVINNSPPNKPTATNLFDFMNAQSDPFGPSFTQSILTVTDRLTVMLASGSSALFQQLFPDATQPVIVVDNRSINPRRPDIFASYQPLLLGDVNIPNGFPLTLDNPNPPGINQKVYLGLAQSIIGALNESFQGLADHIERRHLDPHGAHLFQNRSHCQWVTRYTVPDSDSSATARTTTYRTSCTASAKRRDN